MQHVERQLIEVLTRYYFSLSLWDLVLVDEIPAPSLLPYASLQKAQLYYLFGHVDLAFQFIEEAVWWRCVSRLV